jgi:hypothetical protein
VTNLLLFASIVGTLFGVIGGIGMAVEWWERRK